MTDTDTALLEELDQVDFFLQTPVTMRATLNRAAARLRELLEDKADLDWLLAGSNDEDSDHYIIIQEPGEEPTAKTRERIRAARAAREVKP